MAKVKIKKTVYRIANIALDAGTTEVYTGQNNRRYGTGFARILATVDARVSDKGQKRNQIRHTAKNKKFATEEERNNHLRKAHKPKLGQQKQNAQRTKTRTASANEINRALNEVPAQQPKRVIVEDLSHLRGKAKGKKMSRRVSLWMRSVLNERASFKTEARGSRLEAVAFRVYESGMCLLRAHGREKPRGRAFQVPELWHGRYGRWQCSEGDFETFLRSRNEAWDEQVSGQADTGSQKCQHHRGNPWRRL